VGRRARDASAWGAVALVGLAAAAAEAAALDAGGLGRHLRAALADGTADDLCSADGVPRAYSSGDADADALFATLDDTWLGHYGRATDVRDRTPAAEAAQAAAAAARVAAAAAAVAAQAAAAAARVVAAAAACHLKGGSLLAPFALHLVAAFGDAAHAPGP